MFCFLGGRPLAQADTLKTDTMTLQSQDPPQLLAPEKGKGGAGVQLIASEETLAAKPPFPVRNEQGRESRNKEKSSTRGRNTMRSK